MKRWFLALFLLLPSLASGQNSRYDNVAWKGTNPPLTIGFATINVCTGVSFPLVACTTHTASICQSATDMVCSQPNPFLADTNGNFGFWALPGNYTVTISSAGNPSFSYAVTNGLPSGANVSLGNLTVGGNLTATAGQNIMAVYNLAGYIVVDGNKYPRTAAGVQAAVNACSGPCEVWLTPGQYAFGTTTVTVSTNRTHIIGAGKWATEIDYTGPGVAFLFSNGGTEQFQCSIEGILFNGAGDTGNVNQKIAVKLVDVSEFKLADIAVQNWKGNSGSGTTPSIGIWTQGRELSTIDRVSISADRPIFIDLDPNISTENLDAWTFRDNYLLTQVSTEQGIVIVPGSIIYHSRWNGIDCIFGNGCINWNETTAVAAVSYDNSFENLHHEQATAGTTYSYNFARSNAGASFLQNLRIETAQAAINENGFLVQRTHNFLLKNGITPNTGGTAFNADSTNDDCQIEGGYFQTGGTVTNSCAHATTNLTQLVSPLLGTPTLTTPVINGTSTGTGIASLTLNKGSGVGNYTTASTTYVVADSSALCHTVTIPSGWKLAVSTSGALGTSTAIVNVDAALTDNAACSTANSGILVETQVDAGTIGGTSGFSLNWVITGDGAAHNIALQYKTSNASDSALLLNSSATLTPTMIFTLSPSN